MTIPWEPLRPSESDWVWQEFRNRFQFRPSVDAAQWPGIAEPSPSVTYSVGHVFGDAAAYGELTYDLCVKFLAGLRQIVHPRHDRFVYALDWQHECYRFYPHRAFEFGSEDEWPIPVLPNGDYYIFLARDFRFGAFGHPWESTLCIMGDDLLASLRHNMPRLLDRPIRTR